MAVFRGSGVNVYVRPDKSSVAVLNGNDGLVGDDSNYPDEPLPVVKAEEARTIGMPTPVGEAYWQTVLPGLRVQSTDTGGQFVVHDQPVGFEDPRLPQVQNQIQVDAQMWQFQ